MYTKDLSILEKIQYYMICVVLLLHSLLPLRVLYFFSDMLFILVYYIIGYRKKVVWKNLTSSFPEKSEEELNEVMKEFYHWFCDYIFETIKLYSISEKEMKKRMRFDGMELINESVKRGQSVTLYMAHYCNWEWVVSLKLWTNHPVKVAQIYHPLENKAMNAIFLKIRGRFGHYSVNLEETFPQLMQWHKEGHASITGYISDQVPGYNGMHYWPMFLNHKTPTYTGAERIARMLNTSCYYIDFYRPKRGYYVVKVVNMTETPKTEEKFSITQKYYDLLEASIRRAPSYWLWSHNRWKRTWEIFCEKFTEKERERILSKL